MTNYHHEEDILNQIEKCREAIRRKYRPLKNAKGDIERG